MLYDATIDGRNYRLELEHIAGDWRCRVDGREILVDAVLTRGDVLSVLIDGKAYEIKRERTPTETHLWVGSVCYAAAVRDPRSLRSRRVGMGDDKGPKKLLAPMPGKVVRVLVEEKSEVQAGQGVLVMEAMKMQNEIKSPKKGVVQQIVVGVGASVNAGDVLAIVD
jgi:biotin carboxyl carrier protein